MRHILLIALVVLFASPATLRAQDSGDPAFWKYEVKKTGAGHYQLIFHLILKDKWHIWSLKPGGDGYEIAPSFTFDPNPDVTFKDSITEKGKKTVTKMDGIEGVVTYYSGRIDYVQEVVVTKNTRITGTHQYQVCNDRMCLPPKDKAFEFVLKGGK